MEKIKTFILGVWANKKSILGTVSVVLTAILGALRGTNIIDASALPEIIINGYNITPCVFYIGLAVLGLIGVTGKGFETISTFIERIAQEKENKIITKQEKLIRNEKLTIDEILEIRIEEPVDIKRNKDNE